MKRSQSLNDPIFARAMSTEPRRIPSEIITEVPNHDRPIVHLPTPLHERPQGVWTTDTGLLMPNETTSLLGATSLLSDLDSVENKTCPTCGIYDSWCGIRKSWVHRICVPVTGPAKPDRLQDVFDGQNGRNLHFNMDTMSPAERVATGGNMFRCQTVANGNCALCMEWCQEQGPSQWEQFTGWEWCCNGCWKDLCYRYHTQYLEPNGHQNTLGRFLVFLED